MRWIMVKIYSHKYKNFKFSGKPNLAESSIGLLWDTNLLETPGGTGAGVSGLGAFRQVTYDVWSSDRPFTFDEQANQHSPKF
jgi:hypothetical protein